MDAMPQQAGRLAKRPECGPDRDLAAFMSDPAPVRRRSVIEPLFLALNGRRLFVLQVMPTGPCRGTVLYLPPLAEEMNRCRSHVAEQARALAATGLHCVLLDHYGTGESDGLSAEADWNIWLDDVVAVAHWMAAQHAGRPLTLWGIRLGALLAAELVATGRLDVARLLFWQPVLDGRLYLNQHLRLRIASQMVHGSDRETTSMIMQRLSAGEDVEVAGYVLPGRLAVGMASRKMADWPALAAVRIDWIEAVFEPDQPLPPGSRSLVDKLVAAGGRIQAITVACPMFWQLAGDQDAPAIQQATLRVMGEP